MNTEIFENRNLDYVDNQVSQQFEENELLEKRKSITESKLVSFEYSQNGRDFFAMIKDEDNFFTPEIIEDIQSQLSKEVNICNCPFPNFLYLRLSDYNIRKGFVIDAIEYAFLPF